MLNSSLIIAFSLLKTQSNVLYMHIWFKVICHDIAVCVVIKVPEERVRKDRLLLTAVQDCSMKALKFIFYVMKKTSYLSCIVLANRVRLTVVLLDR